MLESYSSDVIKSDWHYFSLEVVSDSKTDAFEVDQITWKTIILNSLNKLYGLVGEVRAFNILSIQGNMSIIRTQVQDKEIFINSFLAYTFNLSKYIATEIESENAYIKVNKHADFLGLVADETFHV